MVFFLFLYYLISDGRISFLGFILYRKFPFQDSSLSGTILFRNYSIQNESFSGIILIRNYSIQIESFFRNHPFQELSITGNVLSKTLSMQKIFCYFFSSSMLEITRSSTRSSIDDANAEVSHTNLSARESFGSLR